MRLIYKGNNCWSSLKREAGLCSYPTDDNSRRYEKGIGNLVHANSAVYLQFIKKTLSHLDTVTFADKREQTFGVMLYYTLYLDRIGKTGVDSMEEAIARLAGYPAFVTELQELVDYLLEHLEMKTFAVGEGLPVALEQYGCYTREEIFAIFGRQTANKRMQGCVAGVFNIEELNTELFFVTLNKSDKDFSASTMYDDYVVSENQFHWKSQNTDTHKGRGKRFVEQAQNKKKFLLFVREYKRDGFGNTCPFYCFGLVDYISSRDDKPMSIDWRMHQPILPQFINAV